MEIRDYEMFLKKGVVRCYAQSGKASGNLLNWLRLPELASQPLLFMLLGFWRPDVN